MTVRELLDKGVFDVVNVGEDVDREISEIGRAHV